MFLLPLLLLSRLQQMSRLLHSKKINRTTMRFKKSNSYTARHSFKVLAIKPPVLRSEDTLIKQPFIFMSFLSE
ncbi:hypothetical protein EUBSIR_02627 [[Eubacterium] siraeum DSM 15702]|uniref:Uncharacterized protein n=1 Tax=[Eubacterium] siraeum DSM 15702 TaxID=428128 RepID=B0MRZ1_9FIRM|nr:hypothetical protein EUBSIR_02627 [[Eubacterium] siraeum DSM 15702]